MRFLTRTAHVRRLLGSLLALTLVFTTFRLAHGVFYGVVNPSFTQNGQCSTAGWTSSGLVKTPPSPTNPSDCAVLLIAHPTVENPRVSAGISQSFLVDPAKPKLKFYLQPFSDQPGTAFAAQTVTIRNSAGKPIYTKSRNSQIISSDDFFIVEVDLSSYASQRVFLSVEVLADATQADSPSDSRLLFDFDRLVIVNGPETTPGPGW
jgi:hypothetical protein